MRLRLRVAGLSFEFLSQESLWEIGSDGLLSRFLDDGQRDPDFSIRLWGRVASQGGNAAGRRIETQTLCCTFGPDYSQGNVYLRISRRQFRESQESFLDLIIRIVLVASGRAFPLHACGVRVEGSGLLFTGPSGVGKTTLAALWRDQGDALVLGDERLWLRKQEGAYWIYGAPLRSKIGCVSGQGARLRSIFFLHHGPENELRPAVGAQALTALLAQGHLRLYRHVGVAYPVDVFADLVSRIPCYDLDFVPDGRIVGFVRDACVI